MPRPKNEEIIQVWQARWDAAKSRRDVWWAEAAKNAKSLYKGEWEHQQLHPGKEHKIGVNVTYSNIVTLRALIASRDPHINVVPAPTELEPGQDPKQIMAQTMKAASRTEAVLNMQWRRFGVTETVRRVVLDAQIFGVGVLKTYWAQDLSKEETERYPTGQVDENGAMVYEEAPKVNRYEVACDRVSPFDLMVDPACTSPTLEDARYIIHRRLESLETVKNNPVFSKRSELKATHTLADIDKDTEASPLSLAKPIGRDATKASDAAGQDDGTEQVELWECWDREDRRMLVFAADQGTAKDTLKKIFDEDWPYQKMHKGGILQFPFVIYYFNDVPDDFYCLPDPYLIQDQQLALNFVRSKEVSHIERYDPLRLVHEELSKRATEQMEKGARWIKVPEMEMVKDLSAPPIPYDVYAVEKAIKDDIRDVLGVSESKRQGAAIPGVKTATEAQIVETSGDLRSGDRRRAVEQFNGEVAWRMMCLDRQYIQLPQLYQVRGKMGNEWQQITGADLDGEFDVQIEAGSTQPRNQFEELRRAQMIMQFFGGNPDIDQEALSRLLASALEVDYDAIALAPEVKAAMAQQQQQQQQMALMAQLQGRGGGAKPAGNGGRQR